MLPFLFGETRDGFGVCGDDFLDCERHRAWIFVRRNEHLQLVPQPLAGSGKIEIVALDCVSISRHLKRTEDCSEYLEFSERESVASFVFRAIHGHTDLDQMGLELFAILCGMDDDTIANL